MQSIQLSNENFNNLILTRFKQWKSALSTFTSHGLEISMKFEKQITSAVKRCFFSVKPRVIFTTRQLLPATKKDVLPSHYHSNVIYQFVCHCNSRYVGCTSQSLEERIKQHVPRSIANPPASHNRQNLFRSCKANICLQQFHKPPLVNIFLTMPNALFTTTTKNFLFSLEVALLFTFLLLRQLSLNLSIPFCVKKKSSTL